MGSGLTVSSSTLNSDAFPSSATSEQEIEDLFPSKFQNILRLNILDGIPLTFHRPVNVMLYGCQYSFIEQMASFLSEKLNCPINRGPISQIQHQNLFINFPSTFQEALDLKTIAPQHETVAIFIRCHLRGLYYQIKHKWVHKPSGRKYNSLISPPKSMTGTPDEPLTMLDDLTSEPLEQEVPTEEFFTNIRNYESIRQEMWPHWISFRYAVDGDVKEEVAKSTLVHLLSNVIAHQPPASVRVVTSHGVKIVCNTPKARRSPPRRESHESITPTDEV